MGREARTNPQSKEFQPSIDGIVDARGRKLEIGDEIILNVEGPVYFRIIDVRPILNPNAPPNMVQIEIAAALHFYAPKGVAQREFVRVRTAEEAGPMNVFKPNEPVVEAPAEEPPSGPSLVTP